MRTSRRSEPIRGRKAAWVLVARDRTEAWFAGISVTVPYGADDVARCAPDRCPAPGAYEAPHREGGCGFHSATLDPVSWLVPDAVLLDVELFGRVIRHERGWRASRQRVLGAQFPRVCRECQRQEASPVLVTLPSRVVDGWWTVGTRCVRCAWRLRTPGQGEPIAAADLAGLLGTEASWMDESTTTEAMRYLRAA